MILNSLIKSLADSIGGQVINQIHEYQKSAQVEVVQAEILEGWLFKLTTAITEEHRKHLITYDTHVAIMKRIKEVVDNEFDTTKL